MGVNGWRSQGYYREEVIAPIKIVWPYKVDDRVCHDLFPYSHNYTVNPWDTHRVICSFLYALSCLATRSPSRTNSSIYRSCDIFGALCLVCRHWFSQVKIRLCMIGFFIVTYENKKQVHWRLTAILLSESSYESNNNSCYRLRRTGTWIFH